MKILLYGGTLITGIAKVEFDMSEYKATLTISGYENEFFVSKPAIRIESIAEITE